MDSRIESQSASERSPDSTEHVRVEHVTHRFGTQLVLDDVSLDIAPGEIVCLLGASGSGKSTLLRVIAGLVPLQQGTVQLPGLSKAEPGQEPLPEVRRCGFVFQDHVLFPHLTVLKNVEFGLHGWPAEVRRTTAELKLKEVGLAGYESRYPHTLSGGEQQRIALARALASNPMVMLLDEAFANVDAGLRRRLREDTRRTLRDSGASCIVVTHDAEEAMTLGDRIAVLYEGQIVQDDVPDRLWRQPANRFIAELFGGTDAIAGLYKGTSVETLFGSFEISHPTLKPNDPCWLVIRPDAIRLERSRASNIQVSDITRVGDLTQVVLEAEGQRLLARLSEAQHIEIGDKVSVATKREGTFVFPLFDNDNH